MRRSSTLTVGVLAVLLVSGEAQAALRIAVLPIERASASSTDVLLRGLRSLSDVEVIDLRAVRSALGDQAFEAAVLCSRAPCDKVARAAAGWDAIVVSEVAEGGTALRMRLIEAGEGGPRERVRVSRGVAGDLPSAVRSAVIELFPTRAAKMSAVAISGLPAGAAIRFDEEPPVMVQGARLRRRLPPGPHIVEARAKGRVPWRSSFEVPVGAELQLSASLPKRRSWGPWILGAAGVVAAGVGAGLAASAQSRADDWNAACPVGEACAAGFTRERYLSDQSSLDVENAAAAGLIAGGSAAVVGAAIWFLLDPGADGPDGDFSAAGAGVRMRF